MKMIGSLMIAMGIALGLYVGLWWAFIGGIMDVINAIKAPELVALDVALGVIKVVWAGFIGVLTTVIAVFPGWVLVSGSKNK
jgi:hypothetical protein